MKFLVHIPFVEALGCELLRFENGEAEIALTPKDEHLNGWNVVHGGVSMTLLDVAMAHAARSVGVAPTGANAAAAGPDPRGVVTIEMKTSFMRPGVGRVIAKGRLLTKTHTMAFCEGSLVDTHGALLAHATGTFKYLRALPVGEQKLQRPNASD